MDKVEKICRHHRKEYLKISKTAKFESDLLKTNEHVSPQSREILETFVRGRGANVSLTIQKSVNFRNSVELYLRSFKTFHF